MTTQSAQPVLPSVGIAGQPTARIASIDIFRGLTMAVMIFVNELDGVRGLPWWTHHAKAQWNVMTYVDMVFPFFLFIVGLAVPIAIRHRLKKNPSQLALWWHVVSRSASLVILGLILANAEKVNPALTHLSAEAWGLLGLIGAILFWNVYPVSKHHATLFRILRIIGLLTLIAVYALFRRTSHSGQEAWIDGSYPEILGLIGYAYFSVCVLYIPTRRWQWAPFAWFAALTAFCALTTRHLPNFDLPLYVWPFGNGSSPSIIMGGVAVSVIFLGDHRWRAPKQKITVAVLFAAVTLIAGWLLTPLGISKIRATPTWCLYSVGAAILSFAFLYWLCDVKKKTAWALPVRSAGANTLLTYLLPDLYDFLIALSGVSFFDRHFTHGLPGVLWCIVFTFFILGVSTLLTRCRLRMQL